MLYIFDKDGTLIKELPDPKTGTRPANTPAEQELLPNVKSKIKALKDNGHTIAIASNQGGVSWGFMSLSKAYDVMNDAVRKIDADVQVFCPYEPCGKFADEYSAFRHLRKPEPGMITELMNHFAASASDTVYIGDRDSDQKAAEAAGVKFEWARDFFEW